MLHQPGARVGGPIVIPGLFNGRNKAFFFVNYEESRSPGQNTANRTILHPRARAGHRSATPRRADARGQPARARGRERSAVDARSDDRAAARRHPQRRRPQGGRRRSDRPAAAALHVSVRHDRDHAVPDRPRRLQPDRQAPAVAVDELHRPGLDAGHDQQPRADLPGLPGHGQPGLDPLHRRRARCGRRSARTSSTSSQSAAPAARRCSRRRSTRASSAARRSPIRAVPPGHQRRRRHHQRGARPRLPGARGVDEGHREHAELAEGLAQHPDGRLVDAGRRVAGEPAATCRR